MSLIKPLSYKYDSDHHSTQIKSFKIFSQKGDIDVADLPQLKNYLNLMKQKYKKEYDYISTDLQLKINGFEKLETVRSNCCRKMLNGYSCSKNHTIKTYKPEVGYHPFDYVEPAFTNFTTRYKNCHKAYHEQKQVIRDMLDMPAYPIFIKYLEDFYYFINRCQGFCNWCRKKNIRYDTVHPYQFASIANELSHYNLNLISFFYESPEKDNELYAKIEKFVEKNLIENIATRNFMAQINNEKPFNWENLYEKI